MIKGLYAGSFDPITVGHLDIIRRASNLCDELTIVVAQNNSKDPMFVDWQRLGMIQDATCNIKNVKVAVFTEKLLTTYALKHNIDIVFRGLRNSNDFEYELQLSQIYAKQFDNKIQTVYLMTDPKYSYISSSIVRENYMLGADISGWVDDSTLKTMEKIYPRYV